MAGGQVRPAPPAVFRICFPLCLRENHRPLHPIQLFIIAHCTQFNNIIIYLDPVQGKVWPTVDFRPRLTPLESERKHHLPLVFKAILLNEHIEVCERLIGHFIEDS